MRFPQDSRGAARPGWHQLARRCPWWALLCAAAHAQVDAPALAVQARALSTRYHAVERLNGSFPLNQDNGTLHGQGLGLTLRQAGWRGALTADWQHGGLDYDGLTQLGLPLHTRSDLSQRDLALWAGPAAAWDWPVGWAQAELGLSERRQIRRIRATAHSLPTDETLSRTLAGARLRWTTPLGSAAPNWQAQAQLGGHWPLAQRLAVDSFGVLDRYQLQPRARGTVDLGLQLAWQASPGSRWQLGWQVRQDRVGASDAQLVLRGGKPAGIASYPGVSQLQRQWALQGELAF
ncbi:MAG: hypothetical protein CFE45_10540 [Burkholderiales bacterium PBB5]|nr:MAG: hypothetical protein CFE45_10540 [Burkholderiales bacterium PBB5]